MKNWKMIWEKKRRVSLARCLAAGGERIRAPILVESGSNPGGFRDVLNKNLAPSLEKSFQFKNTSSHQILQNDDLNPPLGSK